MLSKLAYVYTLNLSMHDCTCVHICAPVYTKMYNNIWHIIIMQHKKIIIRIRGLLVSQTAVI